jgi:hypothetical protein
MSLTSQLKALYMRPDIAAFLPLADPSTYTAPTIMRDIHDSPGWKEKVIDGTLNDDDKTPFMAERRNIVLSLCCDGVNPWKNSQYSLTPIMMMVMNLPPNLRHHPSNMLLIGLIPGPKKPRVMGTYLQPLMDELHILGTTGVDCTWISAPIQPPTIPPTALVTTPFTLHAKLLVTVADYPGHGDFNEQQVHGAVYGCIKCEIQGYKCPATDRMIYGGYDRWRREDVDIDEKYDGNMDHDIPPPQPAARTNTEIRRVIQDNEMTFIKSAHPDNKKKPKDRYNEKGVIGASALLRDPTFDIVQDTCLDMMHTVMGVAKHIFQLLIGKRTMKVKVPKAASIPTTTTASTSTSTSASTSTSTSTSAPPKRKPRTAKGRAQAANRLKAKANKEVEAEAKQERKADAAIERLIIQEQQKYMTIPPSVQAKMDIRYGHIQASTGVVPKSRLPFSRNGTYQYTMRMRCASLKA